MEGVEEGDTPAKRKAQRKAQRNSRDKARKRKAERAAHDASRTRQRTEQRAAARAAPDSGAGGSADEATPPQPPARPPTQPENDADDDEEEPPARRLTFSADGAGPSAQGRSTPAATDHHAAHAVPQSAAPPPSTGAAATYVRRLRRRLAYAAEKAALAAEEARDDASQEERRRSGRLAGAPQPAAAALASQPAPARTLREHARLAMEYMESLATPRGSKTGPSLDLLADLHAAVHDRLRRLDVLRTGFVATAMVENIKEFLQQLDPYVRSNVPYDVRLYVLAACCGSDLQLVELAAELGLERHGLTKAKALRAQFFASGDLSHAPRANGGVRRRIEERLRRDIWHYWLDNTRPSPMRADNAHKVKARDIDGNMLAEPTVKHIQSISDRAMWQQYIDDTGVRVSLRTFCQVDYCKPGNVRRMPLRTRLVCLSTKDMVAQRLVGWVPQNVRRCFPAHRFPTACRCPAGSPGCVLNIMHTAEFLHRFVKRMKCALAEGAQFHKMACIDGTCKLCGWDKNIGSCPQLFTSKPVTWRTYETDSVTKRLEEVTKSGTMRDFMETLRDTLQSWMPFDFTGRWQAHVFKARCASRRARSGR